MIVAKEPEIKRLVANWFNYGEALPFVRQMNIDIDEAVQMIQKKKDLAKLAWMEIMDTYPQIKKDSDAGLSWGIQLGFSGNVVLTPPKKE